MKLIYKRIKNRLLLEVDLLLWWAQVKKIKFNVKNHEKNKKILFCNLMTMPATAKIESIFAAFIARKKYSIYILLRSRYRYIEKLFSIVVDVEFIYFENYITKKIKEDSVKFVEDYFLKNKSLSVDYEYFGYRVGKNVYSKALRNLRVGKVEYNNSEHIQEIKSVFIESIVAINVAKIIHKKYSFDLAVFIEKGYTPSGEIYDSCILEKINVIQWLGAPQSDHFLFKRYNIKNRAIHPLALSDESWDKIKNSKWNENSNKKLVNKLKSHYEKGAWFNRQQLQNNKKIYSKKEIQEKINLNKKKKTAVIFSHILYDATFFYGDSLFNDYSEWLIESVRCAIKNNHLNWIIKVHPVNVWRSKMDGAKIEQLELELLKKEFGELPENIFFIHADTDINTYSLFNCIDYGLTVRGTIGMELPCFGIPVITAGSGRYSDRGFTYDPKTIEEFNSTLINLHEMPSLDKEKITLARKYAYGTFFMRPFKVNSFELNFHSNTYNIDALKQDTFLDKKLSVKEFEDINTIVDWMLYSKNNDLLNSNVIL